MNKTHKIALAVILVVVALGLGWAFKINSNQYSIVYLSTGEVYIGKLSTFPTLSLKNAYLLQAKPDPADSTKNTFNLSPVKDGAWAPKKLYFVKDNVVFYGPLLADSQIAKALASDSEKK